MSENKARPNILMILTDDQGIWSLGCYGNREIHTSNIDLLAQGGALFRNLFCVSPVCSPARASILTGRIPSAHGVHDWIKKGNLKEDGIEYLKGIQGYTDVLNENGYEVSICGKWHLGSSFVKQKGFSHWYVHQSGAGQYYSAPMVRDGHAVTEKKHVTEAITDEAVRIIENASEDRPFYVSVHYTAPHMPWDRAQYPERYREMYENASFIDCPQEKPHKDALYIYSKEDAREALIGYYSLVTQVDDCVGRLVRALEDRNMLDNTLIIFTTDNGYNFGHHGIWGKGNATRNLNMYDNSVKVPAIFYHRGKIRPMTVDAIQSHYDFFPTILEYCSLDASPDPLRPGKSFAEALLTGEFPDSGETVVFDEYGPVRMIRTDKWKYVDRYPDGENELYDMENDPDERINLYGMTEYASKADEMKDRMEKWFQAHLDPMRDGRREKVMGYGQFCMSGDLNPGKRAFAVSDADEGET
ncbi:MAG: sulfatase-like hydrolase/transferase [Clostridia bacterium]|nr:sulfatase-like hydrolase/transferase [Clostridia bacterium]